MIDFAESLAQVEAMADWVASQQARLGHSESVQSGRRRLLRAALIAPPAAALAGCVGNPGGQSGARELTVAELLQNPNRFANTSGLPVEGSEAADLAHFVNELMLVNYSGPITAADRTTNENFATFLGSQSRKDLFGRDIRRVSGPHIIMSANLEMRNKNLMSIYNWLMFYDNENSAPVYRMMQGSWQTNFRFDPSRDAVIDQMLPVFDIADPASIQYELVDNARGKMAKVGLRFKPQTLDGHGRLNLHSSGRPNERGQEHFFDLIVATRADLLGKD